MIAFSASVNAISMNLLLFIMIREHYQTAVFLPRQKDLDGGIL